MTLKKNTNTYLSQFAALCLIIRKFNNKFPEDADFFDKMSNTSLIKSIYIDEVAPEIEDFMDKAELAPSLVNTPDVDLHTVLDIFDDNIDHQLSINI